MATCIRCRAFLPNATQFCEYCGYMGSNSIDAPTANDNPPNVDYANSTTLPHPAQSYDPLFLGSANQIYPYEPGQVHGFHQQSGFEYGSHQQPGQVHGSHQQPHIRTHLKHAKAAKGGCRPSCLTMIVVMGALVAIVATTALVAYTHPFDSSAPPPSPSLVLTGKAVMGQSIILKGKNFPSGGRVAVTLDDQSLGSTSQPSQVTEMPHANINMSALLLFVPEAPPLGNWITVSSNGTFAIPIHVDEHWNEGSTHSLRAYGQDGKFLTGVGFKALPGVSKPSLVPSLAPCTATASQTTMNIGPLAAGDSQAVFLPFQLCTSGSGTLDWTSSWDQQQAPWLQVDRSGHLTAPLSQQVQIHVSAQNLNAGSYTADVTFTGSPGNTKVVLTITLLVQPKDTLTCIQANQAPLSFTGQQGQRNPASQTVTIRNGSGCKAGSWSAYSDALWLSANPANGSIDLNGSTAVGVGVSLAGLNAGQYIGHLTFYPGAATITVNLTIQLPPACLSVNTSTLTFTVTQGNVPSNQGVTISNGNQCSAGSWTASKDASWLNVNQTGGQIATGGNATVSIGVASTLNAGSYTGHIIFSAGSSTTTVTANVNVLPKPCISANPTSLSFSGTSRSDPASQSVTVSTCAQRAGTVSASVSMTNSSSANWLQVSGGGQISANGQLPFTANTHSASAGLGAGTYTGSVTFVITTSDGVSAQVTVGVTLSVSSPLT